MAATLMPAPRQRFVDNSGIPLANGMVFTFAAGTSDPLAAFTDPDGLIPHANPIRLDIRGEATIYWLGNYKVDVRNALGIQLPGYPVDNYNAVDAQAASSAGIAAAIAAFLGNAGSTLVSFLQAGVGAIKRSVQDELRETVKVTQFGADPTGVLDSTAAFQKAVDYLQTKYSGYEGSLSTVKIPSGTYKITGDNGVVINYNEGNVMQISFEADSGATIKGTGTNKCFNFTNGGYRNYIRKLNLLEFGSAIYWTTKNRTDCQLVIEDCGSGKNDIFLDTGSYADSRSSMIKIDGLLSTGTRCVVKHYTDQMTIQNSWMYAKEGSLDALLYLSGDGNVHIKDTFLIPNSVQITPIANARWIDFVSDPAQGTPGDRTLKTLTLSNVRQSLESGRMLIWTFDTCPGNPNGTNQISSITVDNSVCTGTAGYPVVWYRQGYPGSVTLRNTKVFAAEQIVGLWTGNTNPPVPSLPGALTSHVISIDEPTRLTQSNGNNTTSLVDPKLEPFCYDTTSQTSKYKTSIRKNIDYRLRAVAAGSGRVKTVLPIFFDTENAVSNRDILTFQVVTVSDAQGGAFSNPGYRSQAVTLVTIIGGNDGSGLKRIIATTLQDAKGGISFAETAVPLVFWGTGDTGSADIAVTSSGGTEDNITIAWNASTPDTAWAYIIPLAGIRANQQDKMQNNVW